MKPLNALTASGETAIIEALADRTKAIGYLNRGANTSITLADNTSLIGKFKGN